uniref:Uncharacterized protein n=1 Tax=Spironucleus salmonicida TaxID=348837 RepID=V6LQ97_9EUKA|eukprot:EST42934.1 Hypothetical protein SS50377_17466 [Spironucleus salmonicida]
MPISLAPNLSSTRNTHFCFKSLPTRFGVATTRQSANTAFRNLLLGMLNPEAHAQSKRKCGDL